MNDQQSPSAPDPENTPLSSPAVWSRPEHAVSDQEAFSLLAESMAENAGPEPERGSPVGRPDEVPPPVRVRSDAMPPVVPFRSDLSSMSTPTAAAGRFGAPMQSSADNRRSDWSTPILVEDQWEVVNDPESELVHGHVTEVIDLTQVPPVHVGDGGIPEHTSNRILPPVEEFNDARPLPPLVFLNTRGDVMPRVGETANGRNGDTFNNVVAAWDGDEPSVATAISPSGVENMAESRGDFEATADAGRAPDVVDVFEPLDGHVVDPPPPPMDPATAPPPPSPEPAQPGVINAGHTQVLPPRPSASPPPGSFVENIPSIEFDDEIEVDPGVDIDLGHPPPHAAVLPPDAPGIELDARLEELQRIFDQYSGPVIAVIASIAGRRPAIDEALQSTFEAVWKTVDTFDADQPRGPWMFTLARRQATEQLELARRQEQESNPGRYPVPSHRHDEAVAVDKSWEAWEVRLAVDQLNQSEHDVLRLIHNEGLIHPEIAAKLQTTVGAVKSHAYGGSHRLVELLDHVIRPDATEGLTVDQASALTWYLAGVADGSDLDAGERSAVKRVQAQLASATAWITPDPHACERILAFARRTLDDPGPLGAPATGHGLGFVGRNSTDAIVSGPGPVAADVTGAHPEPGGGDDAPKRPWLTIGLTLAGLVALVVAWTVFAGSSDSTSEKVRRYQMQTSGIDGDASGVVEITVVPTGSRYDFEFGGLDATTDDHFYAAWLQSSVEGAIVPLGTFSWRAAGDPLVLSGPTWSDAYDLLVITRSDTMTRASIDDPMVLSVSIE